MNPALLKQIPHSPAFVLDIDQVLTNLQSLHSIRYATACKVLYSIKALPLTSLLHELTGHVDGFSVSSLFEAKLARSVLGISGSVHLTTPGLRPDEFAELAGLCSHISFNSLSQLQHLADRATGYSKGVRVNPKLSCAADARYDPCRRHSKLGVAVELLNRALTEDVAGLHIHTVFGQTDSQPLQAIVQTLKPILQQRRLQWLNLGGGYLYHRFADLQPIIELITDLKTGYVDDVYLEPGKGLVGNAGYLLTTVLDRFVSDGKTVLIMDTSINHHPEVFEYQQQPVLLDAQADGQHLAVLAGSTCLAGDLFGEYRFDTLPAIGDKLLLAEVGAYSLIKANRFNGYPLPTVYQLQDQTLKLLKRDDYADYCRQWLI
ncbi:MAG: carboxynorspermidine decarboxylase [Methylomonas sp.]|nr:MAG: carboxynorspermidine decarboxylase [Methylomonas sp.]